MGPNGLRSPCEGLEHPSQLAVRVNCTNAGLAQLVEHLICNQGVAGSNPATGTNLFNNLHKFEIPLSLFLASFLLLLKWRWQGHDAKIEHMKKTVDQVTWRVEPLPLVTQQEQNDLNLLAKLLQQKMPVIQF